MLRRILDSTSDTIDQKKKKKERKCSTRRVEITNPPKRNEGDRSRVTGAGACEDPDCPRCAHLQVTFAVREIKDRFLL